MKLVVGILFVLGAAYAEDPPAPTPATCEVPWPEYGRWTDCVPETIKNEGEECNFEHQYGHECVYEDGPIACNNKGNFERDRLGPNKCTLIRHPANGGGCARHDFDDNVCKVTEGCKWNPTRSWCEVVCPQAGCGVELHRRDDSCMFNCPLHNATECSSWQAGCGCIQDDGVYPDCESWCTNLNENKFHWLPSRSIASESYRNFADTYDDSKHSVQMKVKDSFAFENDEGYDPYKLCKDACFQRGICVSPKVQV